MNQEEIELQLWEYIDGRCDEAAASRFARLIAEDIVWKEKYNELMAINAGIADSLELEQPSMRFTKNVMEAVAHTHMAPATKKYINPYIIRGIAAVFIIMLVTFLGIALAEANWHTNSSGIFAKLSDYKIEYGRYINIFIAVNIVLGLVLADKVFRRNRIA